ncbi:MAG: bifunctional 2-polyprenyl-6-hydroxyphenol methylase/3-demethylubiquinol 3-O-methyltransferase UbiG [Gammaproteobacteria bacterium]|nr:bifunctional 2-polyprenyl-6-hydroxyphenol methylase/3-demethylubiquinol 3-O-methyltransferase UbiG [Gammaproteobacteria bacterium]
MQQAENNVNTDYIPGDNVDRNEVAKFEAMASRWWDVNGECKPLHAINPLRLNYIDEKSGGIAGKKVIDVGCGGGILSESLVQRGATVSGIDMSQPSIEVAKLHLYESNLEVDYQHATAEAFAERHPHRFDVVTCMELLEHVPDPASVIRACAKLVKPGGHLFFSTVNRNPKAYLFAIIGAEYLLKMLPKGTHDFAKFIRPSELEAWAREVGLSTHDISGLSYNPLNKHYSVGNDIDVNYMMHTQQTAL